MMDGSVTTRAVAGCVLVGLWCASGPAWAQTYQCYAKDSGPTTRTPIDPARWNCLAPEDPCCLSPRGDDVDEDGDGVPARCDGDDHDPDDDGDGLPTAMEDLNGNGSLFDDTDRRSPTGTARPAFLDAASPLDDDGDGYCDCAWAGDVTVPPAFCDSFDDCVDYLADGHPGAPEIADDEHWDHDCLGDNDRDLDGDGFLNAAWVDSGTDCVDTASEIHPGAREDFDGPDRDCDGYTDPPWGLEPNRGCGCDPAGATGLAGGLGAWVVAGLLALRRRGAR